MNARRLVEARDKSRAYADSSGFDDDDNDDNDNDNRRETAQRQSYD